MSDVAEDEAAHPQTGPSSPAHEETSVMPHRRALCLLTSVLALITAVAFLGAGLAMGGPRRVSDPRLAATGEVVHAFYAAANRVIATGDQRALDGVVAEHLVTHGPLPALAPGRGGLARYLLSLHATHPRLELVVGQIVTAQNQALVHLEISGDGAGSFLGSRWRAGSQPWGTIDAIAISGQRVVEFWGGGSGHAMLETLGQAGIEVTSPALLALDRLVIPPDASFSATGADETRLLFVEAGMVTVVATPRGGDESTGQAPQPSRLVAGDLLSLPTRSRIELHNTGGAPASMLVLAAGLQDQESRPPAEVETAFQGWHAALPRISQSGATVAPLTGAVATSLPGEGASVAAGRVTLAPAATLSIAPAAGPYLMVVNQGTLEITAQGEPVWVYHGEGRAETAATLGVATGALLQAGTTATFRNTGNDPAVMTVIAILAGDSAMGAGELQP
jgi:hypothetical protein